MFLERLRKQVNVEVKRVALMQSKLEWREKDIREREGGGRKIFQAIPI